MAMNMSYCRFENTLQALRECENALNEGFRNDPISELSDHEQASAKQLMELCRRMADNFGDGQ